MALRLVWRVERQLRGELTDEVEIEFIDSATELTYQRGSVFVPKRPTADEIKMFVNRRREQLEAETDHAPALAQEEPKPEVVLAKEIAGNVFGAEGPAALPGELVERP